MITLVIGLQIQDMGSIDIYKDYAGLEEKYKPKVNVIHGLFMGMKKKMVDTIRGWI